MTGVSVPAEAIRPHRVEGSRLAASLAWAQLGLAVVMVVVTLVLVVLADPQDPVQPAGWPRVATPISFLEISVVGMIIGARRPRNPIGWILCGVAFAGLIGEVAKQYANVGISRGPGSLPAVEAMTWLAHVSAATSVFPLITFGFLLFPDGRLPSRRWLPVAWAAAITLLVVSVATAFAPGHLGLEFPSRINPFGLEIASRGVFLAVAQVSFGLLLTCVLGSVASMLVRLRRARGDERRQLRWVVYAASVMGVAVVVSMFWYPVPGVQPGSFEGPVAATVLSIAFGVAIFKFRLYDIDAVISKTVVFGLLTAFITAVYTAVVVGLATAIGAQGEPSLVLSVLGAAVVALLFQPARQRVERLANRLIYGEQATPYEVLGQFAQRLAATFPQEELLPQLARLLTAGTGVARAEVWLKSGDRFNRVATWSANEPAGEPQIEPDEILARAHTVLVEHDGEVLGALAVHPGPDRPLTPSQQLLIADLAGQAGLALHNLRLVDDLRASRERLVRAQDLERQRLQRDIQERVELRLAQVGDTLAAVRTTMVADHEAQIVDRLQAETVGALAGLRSLARGVYPPRLAGEGLGSALAAHARAAAQLVEVRADGVGRYPQAVEAAVYFCCLEALQNTAKHARAGRIVVVLSQLGQRLHFSVEDDGVGFDPSASSVGAGLLNMADRAEALGGAIEITSSPGRGTTIAGWLPIPCGRSQP